MSDHLPEESWPDLASCESEPIHLPGSIEANGCMLVLDEQSLTIVQVSSNVLPFVGMEPKSLLGKHLGDVFSKQDEQTLLSGRSSNGKRHHVSGVRAQPNQAALDGLVHRQHELLIIELEPSSTAFAIASEPVIYALLTDAMDELAGTLSLLDLCQRVAVRVRHLTGFDRVMVYRFLKDDSGSVIAEEKREDLVPYLGLRYPRFGHTAASSTSIPSECIASQNGRERAKRRSPAEHQSHHRYAAGHDIVRSPLDVPCVYQYLAQYGRGGVHVDLRR